MARRGFLAEVHRQIKIAAREQERREKQAERERAAHARSQQQQLRSSIRTGQRLARQHAADQKRSEKEKRASYLERQQEKAEDRTEQLQDMYDEIDGLLKATLRKDDYVDLETLRVKVRHPPFDRPELRKPIAVPQRPSNPPEPVLILPDPPRGLRKLFGKRRYEEEVVAANAAHRKALLDWHVACTTVEQGHAEALTRHAQQEEERLATLATEEARYATECDARKVAAEEQNKALDELIVNLGYGTVDAIQEYVAIVLSNSVYPDHFPVKFEFTFDPATAELALRVIIPTPSKLPTAKAFKYVKSSDEIVAVPLSQNECKDRYTSALHQVALRSIHEVFEADRRGLIRTIALEVVTMAVDEGTGRRGAVPLLFAGAEREAFLAFNLSSIVPEKTLARMGGVASKNPYGLVPAERSGVRRV